MIQNRSAVAHRAVVTGFLVVSLAGASLAVAEVEPLEPIVYTGLPNAWSAYISPDDSRITMTDWAVTLEEGMELEFNWEIFVMNVDGSNAVNLTQHPGRDSDSTWLPGGARLSFVSDRTGNNDIFVMNQDGSELVNLTESELEEGEHRWSPDGTRLAVAARHDGDWDIYLMDADGSNLVNLTDRPGTDRRPAWSPDGQRIVFDSDRSGDPEIYLMNADGSGQRRLTHTPGADISAMISPDGRLIAFDSARDGVGPDDPSDRASQLYLMKIDGSEERRLTLTPTGYDVQPNWTSDGRRIVFNSLRDGMRSIYVMDADGENLQRLTHGRHSEFYDTVRRDGVDLALERLALSKELEPERRYVGGGELHALGYELLAAGKPMEAVRLWSAVREDARHFELDLRMALRAAGLDAPPFPEDVLNGIRHEAAAVGIASLRSLNEAYPDWEVLSEHHYESLSRELMSDGREALGGELLEIGVERFPESALLWEALGDALLAVRDKDGAVEAYQVANRIAPDGVDADRLARAQAD